MNRKASVQLLKTVKKLHQKKYRKLTGTFIVERFKTLVPYMEAGWQIDKVFTTREDYTQKFKGIDVYIVSTGEMKKISTLKNPQDILAVVKMKKEENFIEKNLTLLLDDIQDPGNLGTIIRTAEWFGIRQMICSPGTVDVYNPKVIQSAMGAHARMHIMHKELTNIIKSTKLPVYIADTNGSDLFRTKLPENMLLVLGNEGHGISNELKIMASQTVTIPYAHGKLSESLNVSVAGSIIISHWFALHRS